MAWNDLKAAVAAVVRTNGTQAITGALLQSTLNSIIDQVGANATFKGVATPATSPGTPDGPLFYIAYEKGIYANFNAINITEEDGLVIILYLSNWNKINIPLASKDELVQIQSDLNGIKKVEYSLFGSIKNDGSVFNTSSLKMTNFIPVSAGTIINAYDGSTTYPNYRACCFYDVNKVPISSMQFDEAGMQNIILSDSNIPINSYYFRSSTLVSMLNESYIYYKINNGLLKIDEIHRVLLNAEVQKINVDVQNLETDVDLLDDNKSENSDIYEDSYNICPQTYEVGKLIRPNSPTILYNTRYVLFDYIEVLEGKIYYFSCIKGGTRARHQVYFTMWDANKNIITTDVATANQIIIPVGCKYVRISLDTNDLAISDFMLNGRVEWMYDVGSAIPGNYPFMKYLYNNVIDPSKNNILTLRTQKKYVAFGDSITQFGNYPQLCGKYIGAITYNFGVGGTHYAMWNNLPDGLSYDAFSMYRLVDAMVSADWSLQIAGATVIDGINGNTKHTDLVNVMKTINYTEMDIISLAFGTNDYGGNNDLGTLSNNDQGLTTLGSVNYILEKLSLNFPKAHIFVLLPIFRTWSGGAETSDTRLNTKGLTLVQYHDGIKSCCEKNHIPFIDLYNEGINIQNHTTYLSDGCHPTRFGYEWLGRKLAGYLLGR